MSFIDDQISPVELLEDRLLTNTHLIRRHTHVPLPRKYDVTHEGGALVLTTNEADSSEGGTPALEFVHPVLEGRLGSDDEVGGGDVAVVFHVTEK